MCCAPGCGRELYDKKNQFCKKHYDRAWRHSKGTCSIIGCSRPQSARGWCHRHYLRWQKTGVVGGKIAHRNKRPPSGLCQVAGCFQPFESRNMCSFHAQRDRDGMPLDEPVKGRWDYPVDYNNAHHRVRRLWGSARQYPCIECGDQARDWAYDGTDPHQDLGGQSGARWFSQYPEFYMPMCKKCHTKKDGAQTRADLIAYRTWKHKKARADMELN